MYTVSVVGQGSTTLTETLTDHLSASSNAVATVTSLQQPSDPDLEAPTRSAAGVSLELSTDGWTAHGQERSLSAVIDDLAPEYDYCLLDGFDDASVPTVRMGQYKDTADSIAVVSDPSTADLAEVQKAIDATEPYETIESLTAQVKRSSDADRAGAIATFTGRVRGKDNPTDATTEQLEFEKYEGIAAERMARIREEIEARDSVFEVRLHHRTGVIQNGEDIVFVVVLAGHREEAFRAVEDGINRLKDEVPIFKKETTDEGAFWKHEQQQRSKQP